MTRSKPGTNLHTEYKPTYHVKVEITIIQVPTWIQKINQVIVEIIVIQVPTWIQEIIQTAILQFKSYKYKDKNRFRYPLNTQSFP